MVPFGELEQHEQDKDAVFLALVRIARDWIRSPVPRSLLLRVTPTLKDATKRARGGDEVHRACVTGVSAASREANAVRALTANQCEARMQKAASFGGRYRVASDPRARHASKTADGGIPGSAPTGRAAAGDSGDTE